MKALFSVLAILGLAVALTMAATHNAGYVVLVYPPYRAELSLNLALVLLAALYLLLYVSLRLGQHVLSLPAYVRRIKEERRRKKGRSLLSDAVLSFAAGRYAEAEKDAAAALEQDESPRTSALLAARSADELASPGRRDRYLGRIGKTPADYPQVQWKADRT